MRTEVAREGRREGANILVELIARASQLMDMVAGAMEKVWRIGYGTRSGAQQGSLVAIQS